MRWSEPICGDLRGVKHIYRDRPLLATGLLYLKKLHCNAHQCNLHTLWRSECYPPQKECYPPSWGVALDFPTKKCYPPLPPIWKMLPPIMGGSGGGSGYPSRILATPHMGGSTFCYPPSWGVAYIPNIHPTRAWNYWFWIFKSWFLEILPYFERFSTVLSGFEVILALVCLVLI